MDSKILWGGGVCEGLFCKNAVVGSMSRACWMARTT